MILRGERKSITVEVRGHATGPTADSRCLPNQQNTLAHLLGERILVVRRFEFATTVRTVLNKQLSGDGDAPDSAQLPDFNNEEFAMMYETMWEPMTRQCIPTAMQMVGEVGERKVLDVAAGPGSLSELVARSGGHVVAADSSAAMVARAARRLEAYAGSAARAVDGQALDFDDASFDITFSLFGVLGFPGLARRNAGAGSGDPPGWSGLCEHVARHFGELAVSHRFSGVARAER